MDAEENSKVRQLEEKVHELERRLQSPPQNSHALTAAPQPQQYSIADLQPRVPPPPPWVRAIGSFFKFIAGGIGSVSVGLVVLFFKLFFDAPEPELQAIIFLAALSVGLCAAVMWLLGTIMWQKEAE
jgi:hypothetical protein